MLYAMQSSELVFPPASAEHRSSARFNEKEVFTMGCIEIDFAWNEGLTCVKYSDCQNDVEWIYEKKTEHIYGIL